MSSLKLSAVILLLITLFSPVGFAQELAMPGDINGDGVTDHRDFFLYALIFDPHGHRSSNPAEDLNQDFEIDHKDLYLAILGRLRGENGLPPIDLNRTGVLEGRVLEDVGDALVVIPIPDANVFILSSSGHRFRIKTNDQGAFRAANIPAGHVSIRVEHPEYHPGEGRAMIEVNQVSDVTIELMPKRDDLANLRGLVQGAADPFVDFQEPLVGAVVRLMPIDDGQVVGDDNPNHFPGEIDPHQVVFTNHRGFYQFHDLPPGEYRMVVSAHGYESERREIRIVGNESQVQDFLLFELPQGGGALHGTVYSLGEPASDLKGIEPGTEHPIAGAHILLEPDWDDGNHPFDPTLSPPDQPLVLPFPIYETRTNSDGEYKLEGIQPGKYKIRVWAEGHFPEDGEIAIEEGDEIEKDFRLTPIIVEFGSIAGTVFGVTPESNVRLPLADALVALVPRHDFGFPPELVDLHPGAPATFVQSVTTDDSGHYEFPSVPVGLYDLFASARGWGRTSAPAKVEKDATATVDLVIVHTPPPPPSSLEGTVWLQPEGAITVLEPASGAEVVAIPADPDWVDWLPVFPADGTDPAIYPPPNHLVTRTDAEGRYRFDKLRPGKYHVIAHFPDYYPGEELVGVPPGSEVVQDFVLSPVLTGPGKVLGRVTFSPPGIASEPQPIAGAKVVLIGQNDFPIPIPLADPTNPEGIAILPPDFLYETKTNEDGFFEFPRVRPGHYIAHVSANEFQPARQEVFVHPGETIVLHFDLIPDGGGGDTILEGGVFEAHFAKTAAGDIPHPIAGATVIAFPLCIHGDPINGFFDPNGEPCSPRITETNERGRYRFGHLHPGPVVVTVIAEGFHPAVQLIDLPGGQATVLNFFLEPVGGNDPSGLFGQITQWTPFPTFAPVPVVGAHIFLEPLFPLPLPPTGPLPYVLEAKSDERGNYRFNNLEPGPYLMHIRAEGFTSVEDLEVHVHPGRKTRQDVLLYPLDQGSASYHGGVYEVEGDVPPDAKLVLHPIPGATVRLVPDWLPVIEIFPPPNVGFDRKTNEQGMFSFEGLPAGGFGVTVLKEGYVPQSGHILLEDNQVLQEDWFINPHEDGLVRVRGRVQEDTGELDIWIPIEGATLLLVHADGSLPPGGEAHSGPDGDFRFPPIQSGEYLLVVEANGYHRYEEPVDLGEEKEPFILVELENEMEPEPVGAP